MGLKRLAAAWLLCLAAGAASTAQSIVVASTTSTEQSGLFGHLLPAFTKATGIEVKVVAVVDATTMLGAADAVPAAMHSSQAPARRISPMAARL